MSSKVKLILTLFFCGVFAFSCGEDDDEDDVIATGPSATSFGPSVIETDSQIMSLALNVLSSSTLGGSTSLALEDSESSVYAGCTSNGGPWDADTEARMLPENDEFAKQTFYCQLKSDESPDTVQGSFARNYNILCIIEEALGGTLQYDGTSNDLNVTPTTACGWAESQVNSVPEGGYPVTVTGSVPTEGPWTRQIDISLGDEAYQISFANDANSISFKAVDTWIHDSEEGNQALGSEEATGKSGGVISLNIADGTLRGEIIDTYWGRRARIFAQGTINTETAEFSEITTMEGIQGNFGRSGDTSTNAYIELASVKGDSTAGFKFNSTQMTCNDSCDASVNIEGSTLSQTGTECYPSTATCEGNDGISLGQTEEDYSFWKFGADLDDQDGTRSTIETWLDGAGIPTFTSVDKSVTID